MATQDLIDFDDDEAAEDEVQAILAALQSRKEKQQKLKKTIRDRALKSEKQLKGESETVDPILTSILSRMHAHEAGLQSLTEKATSLPPLQVTDTAEEDAEILAARQSLQELGKIALAQGSEIENRLNKRHQRICSMIQGESERSQNQDAARALNELACEVNQALQSLRACHPH